MTNNKFTELILCAHKQQKAKSQTAKMKMKTKTRRTRRGRRATGAQNNYGTDLNKFWKISV